MDRGGCLKKIIGMALLILMLSLISACSNDEGTKEPAKDPVTEEPSEQATTLAGDEIFKTSCITCHSSGDITGGQAKLDATKIHADFKTQEDLLSFVSKNMPQSAPGSLSKEEYEQVVDYLWSQQ
jgi:mono/diheme cytochrome c family protein